MPGAFRLLLIALAMFATGTDAYVLPGLLPEIARTLGVGFGAAAQIVSAYSLVYAVSIIPLAVATSRWPFRIAFAIGLALFVAGCLTSAFATSLAVTLIGRCCCGLGVAIVAPTCAAAAVALQPANRHGRAISIIMFSMSLAMAAGLPAGAFIADAFGWRTTLFLLGALAGIAFVGVLPAAWPERKQTISLPSLAADRLLLLGFATAYLAFVGLYCVYIYFGPVFDRATGPNASRLSSLLWLWGLAGVAGSLAAAWVCDRIGARVLVFVTLACLGANFVALPLSGAAISSTAVSVALWGFCGMMLSIALQRQLVARAPAQTAVLSACFVCALQGGIATAGGIGGALIGKIGPHQLPLLGSAFLALAVLVQWIAVSVADGSLAHKPAWRLAAVKLARHRGDGTGPVKRRPRGEGFGAARGLARD
jgi:predicted MFS family arabinose efflux permease